MSDLIDRQAVIDLLKQMRKDGDMVPWEGKDVFARIRKLPTIQPKKAQLSQEGTTSDLISRQQALDIFDDYNVSVENGELEAYSRDRKRLCELPPIQPETSWYLGSPCEYQNPGVVITQPEAQWIPVSERVPEDLEEVNVTWVNRNPESYYESIKDKPFTATAVYYKGKWYWWSTCAQDLLAEYGERCSVGLLHEAIEVTAWMPFPSPYRKGADT